MNMKKRLMLSIENRFKTRGHIYNGCVHPNEFKTQEEQDAFWYLVKSGKLIRRDCEGMAYELPHERRIELRNLS